MIRHLLTTDVAVMDKTAVAEYLNCSTKTVERYAKAGKLSVKYISGKAVFMQEEVEVLKQEIDTPVHRSLIAPNSPEVEKVEQISLLIPVLLQIIENQKKQALSQKMVITLEEAVQVSGLTRKTLRTAAQKGDINAIKEGRRWKFRTLDLSNYIDSLFGKANTKQT